MLGQNRFSELLGDAGLDLAAYFTESTDDTRNKIKRDVEIAYLEECVITVLMKNAKEKEPYKRIISDYKYHKDEMPSNL